MPECAKAEGDATGNAQRVPLAKIACNTRTSCAARVGRRSDQPSSALRSLAQLGVGIAGSRSIASPCGADGPAEVPSKLATFAAVMMTFLFDQHARRNPGHRRDSHPEPQLRLYNLVAMIASQFEDDDRV